MKELIAIGRIGHFIKKDAGLEMKTRRKGYNKMKVNVSHSEQ